MVLLGSKQSIEWYRSLFDGVKLSFAICNRHKAISHFLSLLANNDDKNDRHRDRTYATCDAHCTANNNNRIMAR